MTSRHLVDPELRPMLDLIPAAVPTAETLGLFREQTATITRLAFEAGDRAVACTEHLVHTADRAIRALVYRPTDLEGDGPAVMHLHGGGFVLGNAELGDARYRAWARAIGATVISVDYRLAPEHPHPAALDDVAAVLDWLRRQATVLAIDPSRIAVSGDSAGGGLAAALCLRTRDSGGPVIAFQLLIYPMLDDRTGRETEPNRFAGEFMWTAAANRFAWDGYLGTRSDGDIPPLAAPARVDDLAGLPPTMIATGALDMFVDENIAYAQRLIHAGVPTELYVAPGAFHGFDAVAPASRIARLFDDRCVNALRRALVPDI